MLALLYPLKDPVEGYSREAFEEDIVQECVTDIRKAFEAGAARVSIDFTEGRLATREDPRNPWTGAGLLPHFIELNNRVLANFSDEERQSIGIHTCPGGDRDSVHSADVPYNNLLPEMFKINAGYFLIQLASERDKDPIFESIGQHSRDDQMCYLGVTVTQSPRPESPQEICDMDRARRETSSPKSASARPTTAASHHSRSTRSPTTAHRTTPATSPSKRSRHASKAPAWPPKNSASAELARSSGPLRRGRFAHELLTPVRGRLRPEGLPRGVRGPARPRRAYGRRPLRVGSRRDRGLHEERRACRPLRLRRGRAARRPRDARPRPRRSPGRPAA